jgi:hypothetical protein
MYALHNENVCVPPSGSPQKRTHTPRSPLSHLHPRNQRKPRLTFLFPPSRPSRSSRLTPSFQTSVTPKNNFSTHEPSRIESNVDNQQLPVESESSRNESESSPAEFQSSPAEFQLSPAEFQSSPVESKSSPSRVQGSPTRFLPISRFQL